MNNLISLSVFVLLLLSSGVKAQPIEVHDVPEPLSPWIDWVLHDEEEIGCPYSYNGDDRTCAWPARLQLDLNDQGGRFVQQWELFSESLIRLPGESDHWPLEVSGNQIKLLVQSKGGEPYVRLSKGKHTIRGQFRWNKLPKSLLITPGSGLVDLKVSGSPVARPQFDAQGQLWLMQEDNEKLSEDNLDIQVFRQIIDGHPIKVSTLIKLRVSGKQRNVTLNSALLDGFIASRINSGLPARLEGDNQLKVQLRPGEWSISVVGRAPNDIQNFAMPEVQDPWPAEEVWVFANDNNMRQVQVTGVTSIDPNQTRLPSEWKNLPAYLLSPKQVLSLDVRERGMNNLVRNDLSLKREMWLDFDGKGYSIKDQLKGRIQQTRINVQPNIELGRVSIGGQAQFITRAAGTESAGVEVRQNSLNLSAESRYTGKHSELPANGWELDLQKVDTHLHLPPGWRVFAITGADNLPDSWIQKWSLLDLFLVMIIVLSVRHFYGWSWAGLALVTVVLVWQESGAPTLIWLNLLAVTALLRVLSEHKIARLLRNYRWLTLGVLAIILLTYMIDTMRISIYPQLDAGYTQQWSSLVEQELADQQPQVRGKSVAAPRASASNVLEEIIVTGSKVSSLRKPEVKQKYSGKQINLKAIDPNSKIQSGPGLPSWSGYRSILLQWSGPVKAEQSSRIILLGPKMNLVIRLLGIALLLALVWCFLRDQDPDTPIEQAPFNWRKLIKSVAAALIISLMLPVVPSILEPANAQTMPNQEMLDTLKERLTEDPACLGSCAQIEQMTIIATAQKLQLRLRVHALSETAIPLPASQDTWLPTQVLLNSNPASALARDADQLIWLSLTKGHHDIVLSGPLSKRVSFPLPLTLSPKFSNWISDDNSWTIEGIDEDGVANSQLQFTRVVSKEDQKSFQTDNGTLPTFVKVTRQLQLGLDWYVQTTVNRVSPQGVPLNVAIPLLENEQLLDEQLSVEGGLAKLNFTASQSTISWSSKLELSDSILLRAVNNPEYLEVWNIDASPVWSVQASGLPVNRYLNRNGQNHRVVPVWQPWPGESLYLEIDRPSGVAGQTVTIQGSQVFVSAGKRVNDVELKLTIRSSRGVQHQVQLPDEAEVQRFEIDGVKQRIQTKTEETANLLSLMLKPGKQDVTVVWREPSAQRIHYGFPAIDLKLPSVNAHASIKFSRDRWVLWAQGPLLGPAVLFWSVLLAMLVLAIVVGKSNLTPLNTWQWFLLAIGLSQTSPALIIVVVVCLIGLSLREKFTVQLKRWQFNLMQVSLIGLIVTSLGIMVAAVANGLLGSPDMQISGNGSGSHFLKWYQDRAAALLPQPVILSVSIWVYRILMLAWAMWLAMSLLKWIQWGWLALSAGGVWRSKSIPEDLPVGNETPKGDLS